MSTQTSDQGNVHHPGEDDEGEIDIRELIGEVVAGWPIILIAMAIAYGMARYELFLTQPIFRTDALVQVEGSQDVERLATIGQMVGELPMSTEIAILRSRSVMGQVARRLRLDIAAQPVYFPRWGAAFARNHRGDDFGEPPSWLEPFAEPEQSWGGERISVTTLDVPDSLVGYRFRVVKLEDDDFQVKDNQGGLVAVGRVGTTTEIRPEALGLEQDKEPIRLFMRELEARPGAAFTVRKLREDQARRIVERGFSTSSGDAPGMLRLRFSGPDPAENARILSGILQTYQTQNIERRSAQAEQTLAFIKEELPQARERMQTAEARLNEFRIEHGSADLTRGSSAIFERTLQLEEDKGAQEQERERALQAFTEQHPQIRNMDAELARIERELARLNERVKDLPELQQEALQLQREAELTSRMYSSMLNRQLELEMSRAGLIGNIRIIDTPTIARSPSGPDTSRVMIIHLAGGLGAALGLIFLLRLMRTGVSDPKLVERRLGLPTYGSIPYSNKQQAIARRQRRRHGKPGLLAILEPNDHAVEAIRSLRTALRFAQFDASNNITMITSPEPAIGKSFLSANLGAMMASAGERVVVVDADLRRGQVHRMTGSDRSPGLTELISGSHTLKEVVRTNTGFGAPHLLPSGTLPPNPSELLISDRFLKLLDELSGTYDQVIIDTPPVLAVTEAADIGRHCGTTLILLKAGTHPMRMIEETVKRLRTAGVNVRGTVFNKVGRARAGRYGYKGGYYYAGYQYDYGQRRKRPWYDLTRLRKRRAGQRRQRPKENS